jgi:hypothetical protein
MGGGLEDESTGRQRFASGERHYLFAPIHQRTLSMTTRLDYTVSPTLSVQLYAQPFVSAGQYDGYRVVTDPQAAAFADRFQFPGAALEPGPALGVPAGLDPVRGLEPGA